MLLFTLNSCTNENKSFQENTNKNSIKEIAGSSTTKYLRYNKEDFEKAKQENKVIFLYFYANWCGICKAERPNIFKAFNEMNYESVIGFEIHFNDDETTKEDKEISKELGIAYQHTIIIINKEGELSYKSLSPLSKEKIKEEISKIL
ncbi:thioredoxin family protein [Candidatus Woesearchaeota archaeon]|nr:thioredoxin family protein [Candidatus Woesearchaeota archaeon]